MIYSVKFIQEFSISDRNWDYEIPNLQKRGAENMVLHKEKNTLTYEMPTLLDIEADSKDHAMRLAEKHKLDWSGIKNISKIEILSSEDSDKVEIDVDSNILPIASIRNNYDFSKLLEKMDKAGATHIQTDLTGFYNYVYDRDLVEKLATKTITNKKPLKVLNSADLADFQYDMASGAEGINIQQYKGKEIITPEIVALSHLANERTISIDRKKKYDSKRDKMTVTDFAKSKSSDSLSGLNETFSEWVKEKIRDELQK